MFSLALMQDAYPDDPPYSKRSTAVYYDEQGHFNVF